MAKENIADRLKKIKTKKEDTPTPIIQKVVKTGRKSAKKEGIEYMRIHTQIPKDLYIELNTLKYLSNTSQIELIEEALKEYLPKVREKLNNKS